jgi:PAS domain S-box-containing protein
MSREEVLTGSPPLFEIFDSIPAILWTADAFTFAFSWISGGVSRILGYSPEEWMASPDFWRDHVHPDDRYVVSLCRSETARCRDHELMYRMIAADRRIVWIRDTVRVHVDDGRAVSLSGIMLDITKEREAMEAVSRSEENYRRLVNASPDAIGVHTRGHFVYVNPKFVQLFGANQEGDLVGRDVLSLVHAESRDIVRSRQVEVAVGNNVPMTREKLIRIDGTPFDAEVMAIPLVFDGAKAVLVIIHAMNDD